jgi:hypothetical protein
VDTKFGQENLKDIDHMVGLGMDKEIILKWNSDGLF